MAQPVKEKLHVLDEFKIHEHLDRLEFLKKEGRNSMFTCPVCGGHRLSISPEGKFNCFSGECSSKSIMEAIKPLKEAIAEKLPAKAPKPPKWVKPPRPKATFEFFYPDFNGEKLVKVVIKYPGDGSKKEVRQHWWTGTIWQPFDMPEEVKAKVQLYRINDPINQKAIATGTPIIVGESESKVDLCLSIGLAATCNIGGSGKWEKYGGVSNLYVPALKEANIVLSPDRGKSGFSHCDRIALDFPNAMWLYADPLHPKWDDLDKRYYLAIGGKAPKEITEQTPSWTEDRLPQINGEDQLWNWLDGDEYDLKNWIEDIADPILARQMILDAIEPRRPYEIKKLSSSHSLFTDSNVVSINPKSIPPQDLDAESFVIGKLLLDPSLIGSVIGNIITADQFYHPLNQEICKTFWELSNESQPVDVLSVHQKLSRKGFGDKISQHDLKNFRDRAEVFADNDIVFQAKTIADKHTLRTGQNLFRELTKLFVDENRDVSGIVDEAQKKFLGFINSKSNSGAIKNLGLVMREFAEAIAKEKAENNGELKTKYLKSGISEFDDRVKFPLGKLIGVIAASSHGKTTWAIQSCREFSLETGLPTILCSYEISEVEACLKHAVMETGISIDILRTQTFSDSKDKDLFGKVADAYSDSNMYVYESNDSVEKLCSNLRAFAFKYGQIGCVCIDYIQLVKPENSSGNTTTDQDRVADQLDSLRKELNCLMIWLIQPTKDIESRSDKRPMFADARGTASYRQKVDGGFYLYRDERYNPSSPDRGLIEIGCEKYRDGAAPWKIKVPFDGRNSRIGNGFKTIFDKIKTINVHSETVEQLSLSPQVQVLSKNELGAIPEPDIANEDFF